MKRHPIHLERGSESNPPSEKTPFLTTVFIPLGSALVAALGLLVQNVPWWVTAIVISYIAVVILLSAVPATVRFSRLIKKGSKRRALARGYVPEIRRFLPTLLPLLEDSRLETVPYIWRSATNLDEGRRIVQMDFAHLSTLREWFSWIDVRLTRRISTTEFESVCDELSQAVFHYTSYCEHSHRQLEDLFRLGSKNEVELRRIRQEWVNARDKHNQTIKAWENIAKNINRDAGEILCSDNFGLLKTIG